MRYRTNIIYRYDGSFDGFLCCVYESYARRELPDAILRPEDGQLSLFEMREIETDAAIAGRVLRSIPARISQEAMLLVERMMLTCAPAREKRALAFLRLGYKRGPGVMDMLGDEAVSAVVKAVRALEQEAHLYTGFVRFTENAGALSAIIEPKNRVLRLIAPHFLDRYPNEAFLIFDRTHQEALAAQNGRGRILPVEALKLPASDEIELAVRALWRQFHASVAIAPRKNKRCQRAHLPLRYRRMMTEFVAEPAPRPKGLPEA